MFALIVILNVSIDIKSGSDRDLFILQTGHMQYFAGLIYTVFLKSIASGAHDGGTSEPHSR